MKFLFYIIAIGLVGYLIYMGFWYFNQRNLIYFPDNQDFEDCPGFADSEKVSFNGTRMYYGGENGPVVVYYHGNAGSACGRSFIKNQLKDMGLSWLFVEYAGYSGDEREPNKELILEDAENAVEFLGKKGTEKVFVMGSSLGSAVAAYHASLKSPEKLVLFSAFPNLKKVVEELKNAVSGSILKDNYKTEEWIRGYENPILMLHGDKDKIVPLSLGRELYESVGSEGKNFVKIEGASHNSILENERAWSEISDFLVK